MTVSPGNGATNVDPIASIGITSHHGTLSNVGLTGSTGTHVKGHYSADKTRWVVDEPLGYGHRYTWSGAAKGSVGKVKPISGSFTTVAPASTISAQFEYVSDGKKVGVGAPIIVQFSGPVTDKAAVEKRMIVHTTPRTVGSWAWLPDSDGGSRLHWRPEHYWTPGTKVDVEADLYGVAAQPGVYGASDVSLKFDVGRSQITYGNVQSHRLVVKQGNKIVFNFPASYGLESDPGRNTPVGDYVTMEQYKIKYMSNPAYGYENIPEPWATRISNNGVFIHGNDSTLSEQGYSNVTHGCVNLSSVNAKKYYDATLFGDPVHITDSRADVPKLDAGDGDIYDWTVPWSQWTAMSALHGGA